MLRPFAVPHAAFLRHEIQVFETRQGLFGRFDEFGEIYLKGPGEGEGAQKARVADAALYGADEGAVEAGCEGEPLLGNAFGQPVQPHSATKNPQPSASPFVFSPRSLPTHSR